jgi:TonB family protein
MAVCREDSVDATLFDPQRFNAIFLTLVILFCASCMAANAADDIKAPQKATSWERYTSGGEEFSALLPKRPLVASISRPRQMLASAPPDGLLYAAYSDGTGYVVLSFDNTKRQEELEVFISEFREYGVFNQGATFERDVALAGFKGKQYHVKSDKTDIGGSVQFYRTKNRVYIFEAVGDARSQPAIERFLKSVTLGTKAKGKDIARLEAERKAAAASSLPALPPAEPKNQPPAPAVADEQVFTPREVTRKAVLVARAEPKYTEDARQQSISGTVVLRAVFSSSGEVIRIRAVSGLPYGLTERAIAAARQIMFIPAIKDGRFVSQYIQIEYNFNLY